KGRREALPTVHGPCEERSKGRRGSYRGVKRHVNISIIRSTSVIHGYPRLVSRKRPRDQSHTRISRPVIAILGNEQDKIAYRTVAQRPSGAYVENKTSVVDIPETIKVT